ncbi:MAG TPA: MFS transporter [Nocardioides sp.]|jgi:MFS family permease|nr:MFS transporter [Nocardioides sp.]
MSETATTSPATLRSFWLDLPREGRMLLSIVVVQFLGTGLVLPFLVVYLHEIRGFSLGDVGLLIGLGPLMGFLAVGPGGAVIDKYGARVVMLFTMCLEVVADVALTFASALPIAVIAVVLQGIAFGVEWPAVQSLIATIVPSGLRQRYFGVNFTLLNLGIGLGGVVGGLVVDVHHPITFQAIYVADALSFLPAIFLLSVPLRHLAGRPVHDGEPPPAETYLQVMRRPGVRMVMLLSFVSSYVGYSQLNAGTQAFAREVGRISTRGLGFAYACNTLVIVLLQLVVLRRIEGRRRTRVIMVMSLIWAVAWLLLGTSGLLPGTFGATVLVASCASVFAVGETLMQPTIPALVNDLAPDHLRGRYNALSTAAFSLAAIVAPMIAGWLIGNGDGAAYIAQLVLGCGAVVVVATYLERRLPAGVNGVPPDQPVDTAATVSA